jgi:hypothetical protein
MLSRFRQPKRSRNPFHHVGDLVGAAGMLLVSLLLIWSAGRAGLSSLLSSYAAMTNQISLANTAVTLNRADPDAHYLRGTMLEGNDDLSGAIEEYEEAASLRPDDYVFWLNLARGRELNGDTAGAIAAARQAVPLAPYYAQPHWQLGNILLRAGERDEAFKELALAGRSNPTLMPGIIDLAWGLSGGNVQFVEQALSPQSEEAYQALGQYFRNRGEVAAAIAMYASAGGAAGRERRTYLSELIAAKRFKEASGLWAIEHPANIVGLMIDPGFEEEGNLEEPGFGWRTDEKTRGFHLFLDTSGPKEGRSSLGVEFNGDFDPGSPVISQLVLVVPRTLYQLHFAARTEAIVTGGLPFVVVIDGNTNNVLGKSAAFPQATNGWRDYTIDFSSGDSTTAVQITLRRERCAEPTCPIFGRLWLDDFSLQKR